MDDGKEPNKKRLNFAFSEGYKKDPQFFDKMTEEFSKEGSPVGKFLLDNGLFWPADQTELEGSDGFLNTLTEEQATAFSALVEDSLPKFAHQA